MANKPIQIGDTDYFLSSDRLNWIVSRRKECKVSMSFPEGYKYVDESYFSTLESAFKEVFEELIRTTDAETIDDILAVCEKTYEMLKRVLDRDFKRAA